MYAHNPQASLLTRFSFLSTPRVALAVFLALLAGCDVGQVALTDPGGSIGVPGDNGLPGSTPAPTCRTDIASQLSALKAPGLSVGIIKHGSLACTAVAGMASIEEQRAVTPDTVFSWASVSKTVTATAAMILVDDGMLGLDDDINGYLPFSARNPNCPGQPITVRQLLTHTSSIVDNETTYDAMYTVGDSPIELGEFVRGYVTAEGPYFDVDENFNTDCPGEVNDYSNVATGLLGHVVEQVAGKPFDQFCRERIFAPLGMSETSFHLANLDASNVAMPYDGASPADFVAHGHIGFPTFPDGLLRSSVPQLARFLAMMAEGGAYSGQRILTEASAREMRQVQFPALDDTQGLIWFYDFNDTLLGHDGGDPGTSAFMFFEPNDGAGVLMVANGDWYDANDESPPAASLLQALLAEARTY